MARMVKIMEDMISVFPTLAHQVAIQIISRTFRSQVGSGQEGTQLVIMIQIE